MRPRNTSQNKRLYGLLNALGIDADSKAEMVLSFTNERTKKSSAMNYYECQNMIDSLQSIVNSNKSAEADKAQKQRRKILSICHEMGWEKTDGKIDWVRLQAWLQKYGHRHCENLNDYLPSELPMLVTQFEKLLKHYYESKHRKS